MGTDRRIAFLAVLALGGGVVVSGCVHAQPAAQGVTPGTPKRLAEEIGALEERSYTAWKSGDTKFWSGFLSENFVAWGPSGRIDKRAAIAALSGAGCKIATYRLTDKQVTEFTANAALLTHRTEVDGACNGKPLTPASYTATVYVREAGQWKAAFRARSAIVDPMKATKPAASDLWTAGPTRTDTATQTLLAREQAMVDAWKDRDAGRMDKFFGPEIQFVDIFGNHIATRADALKAWSAGGCDVKGFEFSGAKATMFAPDFGVLTYRAIYDAKCFGQDVWPIWGTALYVKRGDAWMWSSGINVLAGAAAD